MINQFLKDKDEDENVRYAFEEIVKTLKYAKKEIENGRN